MDRRELLDARRLGPLTNNLVRRSSETWGDLYPSCQGYADECEALLEFIIERGQFDRFLSRLTSRRQQRDEALNEIRTAYLMESLGYPVVAWEPIDAAPYNVEFSVDLGAGFSPGYVEVKSPGWEGELTPEERKAGRKDMDKYIDMEARAASPVGKIRETVEKAARKFSGEFPSLLVILDDFFVSLGNWGWGPLQMALTSSTIAWGPGLFNDPQYITIGAVALLWVKSVKPKGVEFHAICLDNPNVLPTAKLPPQLIKGLCTKLRMPTRDAPQQGSARLPSFIQP